MAVNANKVRHWKADIKRSVDFYNKWFLRFAPKAYRDTRDEVTSQVELALAATRNLLDVSPEVLCANPSVLPILRMCTAPPLAVDRLIGLAGVPPNLVKTMEHHKRLPPRMLKRQVTAGLGAIARMIMRLADRDLFPWIEAREDPTETDVYRAATVVADRLCGAIANPIIRNAQEQRQLSPIRGWLEARGYTYLESGQGTAPEDMKPGTFCFRLNVPVELESGKRIKIPVDAAIKPLRGRNTKLPCNRSGPYGV